jgi:CDP-diacylglycerol pyrophosphatase
MSYLDLDLQECMHLHQQVLSSLKKMFVDVANPIQWLLVPYYTNNVNNSENPLLVDKIITITHDKINHF